MTLGDYDAWVSALESIYQAWSFETDPASPQTKVRKLNREMEEIHLITWLAIVAEIRESTR